MSNITLALIEFVHKVLQVILCLVMTGTVAHLVECALCNREAVGLIPCQVIPKIIAAALLLGAQHFENRARNQNWSARYQYKVNG